MNFAHKAQNASLPLVSSASPEGRTGITTLPGGGSTWQRIIPRRARTLNMYIAVDADEESVRGRRVWLNPGMRRLEYI